MLGVVLVVAWFIYRRTVTYEAPSGSVSGAVTAVQSGPGAPPALMYGGSSLTWTGGIAVLRVTGDPHTIGAAHGRLLAPHLAAAVRATAPSIEGTVSHGGMIGDLTHGIRLAWRWRFVDDGLIDYDRRMVSGVVRGAEASGVALSFEQLIRAQAVLDVGAPSPRTAEAEQKNLALSLTVIAPQAAAPARVWVGRTFSLPGLDDGGDFALPVVTIARPEGRVAWAGVGWPGEIGVVSGINANGIAVFVEPARTSDVRATRVARPVALLARTVLEQAKTLDEAIKLFETTPTLGTAVIAVVDGASGTWVQVERTPSKAIVERSPKAPAIGNVLTTNALSDDPDNDRARRFLPVMQRVERATRLVRTPLPDASAMAAILRDQRSLDDVVRPAGHRGMIDDGRAVHTLVLDPASMELWVGDPSANDRMRAFDLRYELRREGDRASPPADLLADPAADPARRATLTAARADLREARALRDLGELERAAEVCARARARAPGLPEALELEGMLALARGDTAHAREALQAWIDGGSDNSKSEERARSLLAR